MKRKTRISFDSDTNKNYGCFQKVKDKVILIIYDTNGNIVLEKEFVPNEKKEIKRWL